MSQPPSPTEDPSPRPSTERPKFNSPFGQPLESSEASTSDVVDKQRSVSFAAPSMGPRPPPAPRRMSIQFVPAAPKPEAVKVPEGAAPSKGKGKARLSSPPPPSTYLTRVSFDTFNNSSVTDPSFTLVSKHAGYTYNRHQRVFLVAMDQNDYSEFALKWLVEEMAEDGDEIICLRVVEREGKGGNDSALNLQRNYKQEAKQLLEHIQATNAGTDNKAISIIIEFAIGNVEETILTMISIYSPAFLTVGTRGRSLGGIQGLLPGSVSKWCMQNSPVPVVMVRHPDKRRKKMQKRLKDPTRKAYSTILDQSASLAARAAAAASTTDLSTTLSPANRTDSPGTRIENKDEEAEAVAKAIGLSQRLEGWRGGGDIRGKGKKVDIENEGSDWESGRSEGGADIDEEDEDYDVEEGEVEEVSGIDSPSPTRAGFAEVESIGIEDMPNYVGEPEQVQKEDAKTDHDENDKPPAATEDDDGTEGRETPRSPPETVEEPQKAADKEESPKDGNEARTETESESESQK